MKLEGDGDHPLDNYDDQMFLERALQRICSVVCKVLKKVIFRSFTLTL